MLLQAVLSNAQHPEYGVATIPFPIREEDYDGIIELLEPLEIGDAVKRDCRIEEIRGEYPALRTMEETRVNLDELDYLAKRLDSFDDREKAQFQATAARLELFEVQDLINLTFCCQQATIITDFSDLAKIGRGHYLTTHEGGVCPDELDAIDGEMVTRQLMDYQIGRVTYFGVVYDNDMELKEVYDNDMELKEVYDGRQLPEYRYEDCLLELELKRADSPEKSDGTILYLPMADSRIERAMLRAGVTDSEPRLRFLESELPDEVDVQLDFEHENLVSLNELCRTVAALSPADREKLGAVVQYAQPAYAFQMQALAENLELFDYVPRVQTAEEYGRYMIAESGHFAYDENLADCYDYERYGLHRMAQEPGEFLLRGYVSYHGVLSIDELMMEGQEEQQDFEIGGMQ